MKASPFRKIICGLLCFFLMIFFLIVFIKKEETPSDTMSICTDELMYPHIQNMTKYYQMAIDQQALFEITVIPSSGAEKEAVCKKLRTELMSGKGKDIYLLTDQATQGSSGSGEGCKISTPSFFNCSKAAGLWISGPYVYTGRSGFSASARRTASTARFTPMQYPKTSARKTVTNLFMPTVYRRKKRAARESGYSLP